MNWVDILVAVISALGGGGLTALMLRKETKAGAKTDVIDKQAAAIDKMLDNFDKQQEVFNKQVEQKDTIIEQNAMLLKSLQAEIDENKRTIAEQKILINENTRKLKGHQTILMEELGKKKYAERLICFREDCPDRLPPLATYKSDDPKEKGKQ